KGASYDKLVKTHKEYLKAVILIGTDNDGLVDALRRHAPNVLVYVYYLNDRTIEVTDGPAVMREVENMTNNIAKPDDTVLLSPAASTRDQFANYKVRGEAFTEAIASLLSDINYPGH